MKRLAILILFLLTFFASVPAVSGSEKTVRVWIGAIAEEKEVMDELAMEFKEKTGVNVEVYQKLEIFTVPNALVNNAELDERPDIVYMQAPDIGGLAESGYLLPLEIDDDLRSRFVDVAFEAFTYNNQVYGIGYSNSTYGLLYNKDLIREDELPETWDELFEKAEALTLRDETGNIVQRGLFLNANDMWFNYPLIKKYGGYYYGTYPNGEYNAYDVGLDNEGMLAYVEKMKELKALGMVLNNPEKKDYSDIVAEFSKGSVAMFFYGLWHAEFFKNANVNYGIAPLPENAKPITTVEGFVVNKFTREEAAALEFLRFILEDDNQQRLIEAGNRHQRKTGERNPTNINVINSPYIQEDEVLASIAQVGRNVEPFPNIPEGTLWYNQDVTFNTFRAIFFGDSSGNEVDAQYKLNELADYIRRNVALMNEEVEFVKTPWYVFAILGGAILALAAYLFVKKIKQRRDPNYFPTKHSRTLTLLAWGLMLPLLALLLMFYVYPIIHNFYLSFTNYSGLNLRNYGIVGIANYKTIFLAGLQGLVQLILWTFVFALSVVAISFVFGTFLATILDKTNVRVAKVYRLIYILPWVIPSIITLLMWQGLLDTESGLVNKLLGLIGIGKIPWLSNAHMARLSTILVMVWFSFPYFMVIAYSFLKSIPKDYYEAARIDGASSFAIFRKITLPLIFRALIPILIMSFIMQFNQFGVYILTGGGPASPRIGNPGATDLLITYVFNTAFNTKRYSLAAAYSVIIFIFVACFALITMRANKKKMEV
ncbi:MAG: extracellular solute-binding protein [Bacilli bacterium]|jgi:arabinogalactan oligomer/maltooligosaccharide transport system permease protein